MIEPFQAISVLSEANWEKEEKKIGKWSKRRTKKAAVASGETDEEPGRLSFPSWIGQSERGTGEVRGRPLTVRIRRNIRSVFPFFNMELIGN